MNGRARSLDLSPTSAPVGYRILPDLTRRPLAPQMTLRRVVLVVSLLVLGALFGALAVVLSTDADDCRCNPAERELGLAKCS